MRKEIEGHPNYIVSSVGYVIKKSTGKRMATTLTEDGYVIVRITQNNKIKRLRLHRLVALHFVPNPENKPEVNHKDGNKLNCRATNCEWNTRQENAKHAQETGLYTFRRKKKKVKK